MRRRDERTKNGERRKKREISGNVILINLKKYKITVYSIVN
jgi:hypothetical protein